jgi:excisionase family DNA binding protein
MIKAYEPLYTVKEAAKVLKINVSAVYRLINTKQLVGLRLGSVKVRGSDLERFLEQYPALNPEEAKEGEMEGE